MARPGETEVFFISPEKGKCYEHVEATRDEYIGDGKRRYFTTNVPKYVGEYTRQMRSGSGDGMEVYSYFEDSRTGKTHEIAHSYEGNTCFLEVPCPPTPMERRGPIVAAWLRAQGVAKEDMPAETAGRFGNLLTKNKFGGEGGKRKTYRKKKSTTRRRKQTRRNH
jgi:hypothetical protein